MVTEITSPLEEMPMGNAPAFGAVAKPVVLVPGSAGLIGAKIVEAFAANYCVVGLDVKRPQQEVAGADWIECNVTQDASVARALSTVQAQYGNRLASVLHLAAY
jgi:nucleoside-diphosphate-sugar epimerase